MRSYVERYPVIRCNCFKIRETKIILSCTWSRSTTRSWPRRPLGLRPQATSRESRQSISFHLSFQIKINILSSILPNQNKYPFTIKPFRLRQSCPSGPLPKALRFGAPRKRIFFQLHKRFVSVFEKDYLPELSRFDPKLTVKRRTIYGHIFLSQFKGGILGK